MEERLAGWLDGGRQTYRTESAGRCACVRVGVGCPHVRSTDVRVSVRVRVACASWGYKHHQPRRRNSDVFVRVPFPHTNIGTAFGLDRTPYDIRTPPDATEGADPPVRE